VNRECSGTFINSLTAQKQSDQASLTVNVFLVSPRCVGNKIFFFCQLNKTLWERIFGRILGTCDLCSSVVYSYFEKVCQKKVHATIPKGNMGYDQYTVSDTVAVEPTFAASL